MIKYIDGLNSRREEILQFLIDHNNDFPIPLTEKVNLNDYVDKILSCGKVLLALSNNKIIGILIYYDNNIIDKIAFISLLLVDEGYRNKGIAKNLLDLVICKVQKKMEWCDVPTHVTNIAAINLYKSRNFFRTYDDRNDGTIILRKNLLGKASS